ncbi:hypothetical protein L486_04437 [Kwoniella mangroviensis CBS 10435]|uniref:Uncharacterized protein n=1 Tax=Kwoniella mangroviensis CBS 10435 TaxID=1331196 RepID=A0A1B9ISL8_9TREE|nr:uncharacterized protein I203_08498 [Kwoniella mangroviensis CBS 8507]OCF58404.1 hypothetical protein L486_04437 [Kwoniella mangroviensis CBS 10435]OCF62429.1 hypothetical protein I203_08498 [Kwoniella mangroviensis CBS 8507]
MDQIPSSNSSSSQGYNENSAHPLISRTYRSRRLNKLRSSSADLVSTGSEGYSTLLEHRQNPRKMRYAPNATYTSMMSTEQEQPDQPDQLDGVGDTSQNASEGNVQAQAEDGDEIHAMMGHSTSNESLSGWSMRTRYHGDAAGVESDSANIIDDTGTASSQHQSITDRDRDGQRWKLPKDLNEELEIWAMRRTGKDIRQVYGLDACPEDCICKNGKAFDVVRGL